MKHNNDLNGIYRVTWDKKYYIVPMVNGVGNTNCIRLQSFTNLEEGEFVNCCFNINSGSETEYEPATEVECNWFLTCSNARKFIPMSKTIDEFSLYIN